MNIYSIYISVNESEYTSKVIVAGNNIIVCKPIEEDMYPVCIDNFVMIFDEPVVAIFDENRNKIYDYED